MGIFLEIKPVDLLVVGMRAGTREAELACTVTWSLPQYLRSVDTCSLANCGLHKAALLEIRSRSMNWGSLTGGCPMGESGTLPHPRYRWPWHERCLLMDRLRSWTRPWGTTVLSIIVPSVPPLTPPSSKCHRHQGRNKSLSDTEREKGARAGKRRDEKCPFYDSHNKAGHMIRSKHFSGKREGENRGESAKKQSCFSPLEDAHGELIAGYRWPLKVNIPGKERCLKASESSLQRLTLPCEMLHAAHVHHEQKAEA